jgi:hypothetical protein
MSLERVLVYFKFLIYLGTRDTQSQIQVFRLCPTYDQSLAEAGERNRLTGSSLTKICLDSFMN